MMHAAAALLAIILAADAPAAPAGPNLVSLPAGTHLRFHVVDTLSSDGSKTGQPFTFVMLDPIEIDGNVLVAGGTVGSGTVVLAGHAGKKGHEGDLTLRLDTLPATNGAEVIFCQQSMRINGRNRKIESGALGFIPYAGLGAMFIKGSDIRIDPDTPIDTVLTKDTATPPNYCPVVITKR